MANKKQGEVEVKEVDEVPPGFVVDPDDQDDIDIEETLDSEEVEEGEASSVAKGPDGTAYYNQPGPGEGNPALTNNPALDEGNIK